MPGMLSSAQCSACRLFHRAYDFCRYGFDIIISQGAGGKGASESTEGPGPLVSSIAAKGSGGFPVPITIVPGNLSAEDIDAIT